MAGAIIVTGVAPLSLGEGIVHEIGVWKSDPLIVLDKIPNPSLKRLLKDRGLFIKEDLNPFEIHGNQEVLFEDRIARKLENGLKKLGADFISTLINNAGIYDFGTVDELPYERIQKLFGVNALGHIGMLRAVMRVNRKYGVANKRRLRLCEVGSFQGLMPRGGRSIYCLTKGGMIDFCQALANGELEHVVYIAPPSIDTPMLHFNHWVTKAQGDKTFWENIYMKDIALYRSIFLNCNHTLTYSHFARFPKNEQRKLNRAFRDYERIRNQYLNAKEGVATVTEVSETVIHYTFNPLQRPVIVLGQVSNDCDERHYGVTEKDLEYDGDHPFSKRALMLS
ncbi:MAG: SDR family NAD(P)-dependent oxidoreductase [Candidatus Sungbacteria bacterium]|nr:SDR family NAD(P)-dependent oxidoreductase [Candidatus Sungbacteria bacterium]